MVYFATLETNTAATAATLSDPPIEAKTKDSTQSSVNVIGITTILKKDNYKTPVTMEIRTELLGTKIRYNGFVKLDNNTEEFVGFLDFSVRFNDFTCIDISKEQYETAINKDKTLKDYADYLKKNGSLIHLSGAALLCTYL